MAVFVSSFEHVGMETHFHDENVFSSFPGLFELRFQPWVALTLCNNLVQFGA